jgi:hypothetical protein
MPDFNPPPEPNPFSAPQSSPVAAPADPTLQGDATGGLIPYKNPHALIAYYLGIIACIPVIGMPFGIASVILGISGLRKRKANPVIKGSAHAIIGILGGVFSLLCGGVVIVALFIARNQGTQ